MSISFQCGCGRKIEAPDSAAGKAGKCPGCGNAFTVPVPGMAAPGVAMAPGAGPSAGPLRAVAAKQDNNEITFVFQSVYPMAVATEVASFFEAQGYRLEGGDKLNGTYGTGSDVLRILFGGFVKRYKFDINIVPQEGKVLLTVKKGMSGAMGGLLGYSRMKKELDRIYTELQESFR